MSMLLAAVCACLAATVPVHAQTADGAELFPARITEITRQETKVDDFSGHPYIQQDLRLVGEGGAWKGASLDIHGVGDIQVIGIPVYAAGDRVIVAATRDDDGAYQYYVMDFIRTRPLILLAAIFVVCLLGIGRWKGVKALASLTLSFIIIGAAVIPSILAGAPPVLVAVIGSLAILVLSIYLTEGVTLLSHVAVVTVFFSLIVTGTLSALFTKLAHLAGTAQEEALFLSSLTEHPIQFQGLLLAGMIIATIGVLDDVIVSQLAAVEQIKHANPSLAPRDVFRKAYTIGVAHIGSVTNTLFLVYAGGALPLLLLFSVKTSHQLTIAQIINLEQVATEIVRTLVGSIGILIAMPVATLLGAYMLHGMAHTHDHHH